MLILLVCLAEMTLLSSQTPSLETSSAATESPEQRMLEKRSKVVEELLQTERDYIRDLDMCVERIMVPLQQAQVGARGQPGVCHWWDGVRILSPLCSWRLPSSNTGTHRGNTAMLRGAGCVLLLPALIAIAHLFWDPAELSPLLRARDLIASITDSFPGAGIVPLHLVCRLNSLAGERTYGVLAWGQSWWEERKNIR